MDIYTSLFTAEDIISLLYYTFTTKRKLKHENLQSIPPERPYGAVSRLLPGSAHPGL